MKKEEKKGDSFENAPLFRQVLAEGLAIQDRFSAEPVYAKTGKGYLKSIGVAELAEIKRNLKSSRKPPEDDR